MELIWSPQSLQDIEDIGHYIAEDQPNRAKLFVEELIKSVERLSEFPESGKIILENPIFRQVVHQKYRLIYQVRINKILIITVLSPRRDK